MGEDWKAGDVAVCVDVAPRGHPFDRDLRQFRVGGHYRVSETCPCCGGLYFREVICHGFHGFWENRFRKLRPSTESVQDMIRRCQPMPVKDREHA